MKDMLVGLVQSKKFLASVIAALTAFIANYFELDNETVALMIAPFLAYILGQGIADNGKEAALAQLAAHYMNQDIDEG